MTDNLRWSKFELLIRAALKETIFDMDWDLPDTNEPIEFSLRHKKQMNRMFRTRCGGSYIPYPEVDTVFARLSDEVIAVFISAKEHWTRYWRKRQDRTEMEELYRRMFDYLAEE